MSSATRQAGGYSMLLDSGDDAHGAAGWTNAIVTPDRESRHTTKLLDAWLIVGNGIPPTNRKPFNY